MALYDPETTPPDEVLLDQIQTGGYYPAGQFFGAPGGKGLCLMKFRAGYKMYVNPAAVTMEDIHTVFFADPSSLPTSRGSILSQTTSPLMVEMRDLLAAFLKQLQPAEGRAAPASRNRASDNQGCCTCCRCCQLSRPA